MGRASVLDRFRQIEPVARVAVPSSHYNGKPIDKGAVLAEMVAALPSVKTLILMPGESSHPLPQGVTVAHWAEVTAKPAPVQVEALPFDHPLWIVYSSGTTGLPRAIVHSHGGIVVEMLQMMASYGSRGPD